jgi:hypothetical protein
MTLCCGLEVHAGCNMSGQHDCSPACLGHTPHCEGSGNGCPRKSYVQTVVSGLEELVQVLVQQFSEQGSRNAFIGFGEKGESSLLVLWSCRGWAGGKITKQNFFDSVDKVVWGMGTRTLTLATRCVGTVTQSGPL